MSEYCENCADMAERVRELEMQLERPEPPGAWVSEAVYLKTREDYEHRITRLREALETLRSRCAANIPIWNDQGHGLDTICAPCEMMAQKAVLATPLGGDE